MEQGNTMKCNVAGLEGFSGFFFSPRRSMIPWEEPKNSMEKVI